LDVSVVAQGIKATTGTNAMDLKNISGANTAT